MNILDLKKQIQDKNAGGIYIFTGEELEVRKIYTHKLAESRNLQIIKADAVKDIISALNNQGFVQCDKCYIIYNDMDFLKAENSWDTVKAMINNNILILVYENMDKRGAFYKHFEAHITEFEHLSNELLTVYIQRLIDVPSNYCGFLIEACENDYSRILLEIDKIKQYSKVFPNMSEADILMKFLNEQIIYNPPRNSIFDVVDAICRGDIATSYELYSEYASINDTPLPLLSLIYNNMKQMLQVQSCQSTDISAVTGLTPWVVKKLKEKIGAYSIAELVRILRFLQKTDEALKTGKIDMDIAGRYILLEVLR